MISMLFLFARYFLVIFGFSFAKRGLSFAKLRSLDAKLDFRNEKTIFFDINIKSGVKKIKFGEN